MDTARTGAPIEWMEAEDGTTNGGDEKPLLLPSAPPRSNLSLFPFISIAVLAFLADALTKLWAVFALEIHGRGALSIIPGYLDLVVARNPGAAFSVLAHAPESFRRPFFVAVPIVASVFVALLYRRIPAHRTLARVGLPLVLGGALGNLVDRIRDGAVVDFIQAHAGGHFWPTFNVADVAVAVGGALLVIDGLRSRRQTN